MTPRTVRARPPSAATSEPVTSTRSAGTLPRAGSAGETTRCGVSQAVRLPRGGHLVVSAERDGPRGVGPDAVVCGCMGCGQDGRIEAHRLVSPAREAVAGERVVAEDLMPVVGEEEGDAGVGGHLEELVHPGRMWSTRTSRRPALDPKWCTTSAGETSARSAMSSSAASRTRARPVRSSTELTSSRLTLRSVAGQGLRISLGKCAALPAFA